MYPPFDISPYDNVPYNLTVIAKQLLLHKNHLGKESGRAGARRQVHNLVVTRQEFELGKTIHGLPVMVVVNAVLVYPETLVRVVILGNVSPLEADRGWSDVWSNCA